MKLKEKWCDEFYKGIPSYSFLTAQYERRLKEAWLTGFEFAKRTIVIHINAYDSISYDEVKRLGNSDVEEIISGTT